MTSQVEYKPTKRQLETPPCESEGEDERFQDESPSPKKKTKTTPKKAVKKSSPGSTPSTPKKAAKTWPGHEILKLLELINPKPVSSAQPTRLTYRLAFPGRKSRGRWMDVTRRCGVRAMQLLLTPLVLPEQGTSESGPCTRQADKAVRAYPTQTPRCYPRFGRLIRCNLEHREQIAPKVAECAYSLACISCLSCLMALPSHMTALGFIDYHQLCLILMAWRRV